MPMLNNTFVLFKLSHTVLLAEGQQHAPVVHLQVHDCGLLDDLPWTSSDQNGGFLGKSDLLRLEMVTFFIAPFVAESYCTKSENTISTTIFQVEIFYEQDVILT